MLENSDWRVLVARARKLAATFHLSVAERQVLPGGRMPWTAILEAVRQETSESGWFPSDRKGPNLVGEGAVIELRGADFVVHARHEIGVMRYSDVEAQTASSLEEAVAIYLTAVAPTGKIDGVHIERHE